jgi:hypothetical protein
MTNNKKVFFTTVMVEYSNAWFEFCIQRFCLENKREMKKVNNQNDQETIRYKNHKLIK